MSKQGKQQQRPRVNKASANQPVSQQKEGKAQQAVPAIQKMPGEDEDQMGMMKPDPMQRSVEEEKPSTASLKKNPAQRNPEEEKPGAASLKKNPAQRNLEEEKPGAASLKKNPAQRNPEEEKPGAASLKKNPAQLDDDEEKPAPMSSPEDDDIQLKVNPAQRDENLDLDGDDIQMKDAPVQRDTEGGGGGNSLPTDVNAKMEQSMGADFSDINIHSNSSTATDVGALAFAQGNDVHFAPGQYNPSSSKGQELIGHELAHVVQQREGRVQPTTEVSGVPVNDDPGLEKEADQMGAKAAQFKIDPAAQRKQSSSASSSSAGQMMWDLAKFKTETAVDWVRRGSGVQRIDSLIDTYDQLQKDWLGSKKSDLVFIHQEIKKSIEGWISYHQSESRQAPRIAAFRKYLATNWQLEKDRLDMRSDVGDVDEHGVEVESSDAVKKLKIQHEGTGDALFKKIAAIVNTMVPNNGDSAKLEVQVKIPTGAGTFYVGGGLTLEASKDDGFVKTKGAVALLLGGTAGLISLEGKLEGFVEAEAATAEQAIELMSYGLYQRARSSSICPAELTNAMWGGGETGSLGYAAAEEKAADRERRIFLPLKTRKAELEARMVGINSRIDEANTELAAVMGGGHREDNKAKIDAAMDKLDAANAEKTEVEGEIAKVEAEIEHTGVVTGGSVGMKVEGGVGGVGKFEVEGTRSSGRKIDLGVLEEARGDDIGTVRERGEQRIRGTSVTGYEIKGSMEFGPGKAEIVYTREYEGDGPPKSGIEVSGELSIPVSGTLAGAIIPPIVDLGARGAEFIRLHVLKSEQENDPSGSGVAANYAMGEALSFSSLQSSSTDVVPKLEAYDPNASSDTLEGKVALKVAISKELNGGDWTIELGYTKEVGLNVGVLAAKVEKGQRLLKGTYSGGQWSWS